MKQEDIVNKILNYISTIDYNVTNEQVSLFETTIRYLGGMLAGDLYDTMIRGMHTDDYQLGYDLLKGPLSNLTTNSTAVDALLSQAQTLANNLKFAFDTPTGIPSNNLYINNDTTDGSTTNGIATIGTLVLEWTRLSDLLGDPEYGALAQKGESYLLSPQPATSEPWPGLVGTNVDINTGLFQDASGGWVGGDDSFYEYLIKMYVYDPSRFEEYRDRWIAAADSTIAHLASSPSTRPDLTFVAQFDNQSLIYQSEHCEYLTRPPALV
jgi:mannosyl-oligosaccharide alpha-1,2-mannosidase